MTFPSLRQFVVPRVPVISEPNVLTTEPSQPPNPDSEVALKWGAPAYLNFSLDLEDIGKPPPQKPYYVSRSLDEFLIRHGSGVLKAVNHDGETVAQSIDDQMWGVRSLFFIKSFVETTEESKQVGGTTVITPKIKHVDLYVEWTDLFFFGVDVIYEENDFQAI